MRKVTVLLAMEATLLVDEGVAMADVEFSLVTDNTAVTVEGSTVDRIEVMDSK